jgi:epsilon-lactone hydrolase
LPSLRAVLFNWYMKAVFKSKPIHLIDARILRANAEKLAPKTVPDNLTLEAVEEDGVRGEWHRPDTSGNNRVIYYLHGGGYVFGSPKAYRAFTFSMAHAAKANVFSLDYRMAPEHKFPAAVDDAVAGYQWLLEQGCDPARIVVGGDSAGGGLALALFLSLKNLGLPMPAGGFLYSPWTDLAATGASLSRNEKTDVMFKKIYITEGANRYLAGVDKKAPLASPLYADLSGLPPLQIYASEAEVLLDDSLRLQERLEAAGVQSELILEKGLAHVWPVFVGRFPEADRDMARSAAFIRGRLPEGAAP